MTHGRVYQIQNKANEIDRIDLDYISEVDQYAVLNADYMYIVEASDRDMEDLKRYLKKTELIQHEGYCLYSFVVTKETLTNIEAQIRASLLMIADEVDKCLVTSESSYMGTLARVRRETRISSTYFYIEDGIYDLAYTYEYLKQRIGKTIYITEVLGYHR